MGQHTTAHRNQTRTQRTHMAVGSQVFGGDGLRLALQHLLPVRARRLEHAAHAGQCPGQVHGRGACGIEPLQGWFKLERGFRTVDGLDLARRQHHAPTSGNADGRRAAHSQRMDGHGNLVTVAATQVLDLEWQLALVQQFQRIPGPQDRADMVVAFVIEVGRHGCSLTAPRCTQATTLKPARNRKPARRQSGPYPA